MFSVLKAGHPGVPCYIHVRFFVYITVGHGWVGYLSFLSYFHTLVCYINTCISMYSTHQTLPILFRSISTNKTERYRRARANDPVY